MKASIKDKILLIIGGLFLMVLVCLLVYDLTRRGIYSPKMGLNVVVVGNDGVSVLLLRRTPSTPVIWQGLHHRTQACCTGTVPA